MFMEVTWIWLDFTHATQLLIFTLPSSINTEEQAEPPEAEKTLIFALHLQHFFRSFLVFNTDVWKGKQYSVTVVMFH